MESDSLGNDMFDRIPTEILAEILSHLKASDRKQARLVCSRWNEASKEPIVLKRQKFLFKRLFHDNQLNLFFDIIENGQFIYCNFEFEQANFFDEHFDRFIESQGDAIRSLYFNGCTLPFETLEKIIIKCINLEELLIFDLNRNIDNAILPVPVVNGTRITRKKLKVLRVGACKWMSDLFLTTFIDIYPNIRELGLDCRPNDNHLTFRNFYQTITEKCRKIDHLSLKTPFSDDITDNNFATLASSAYIRLKILTFIPSNQIISSSGYQKFLTIQTNLTSLDIFECVNFDFECFRLLLRQSPNLKVLRIKLIADPPIRELFELLAKSRLKAIQCKIRTDFTNIQHIDPSLVNENLKTLVLYLKESKNVRLLPIFRIFRNISALNVSIFVANLLDARETTSYIFESLVNLRMLVLRQNWIEDVSPEKCERLTKLEHLELYESHKLTGNVITKFNFPKLKFLCLHECVEIKRHEWIYLSQTSPLLEHFEISSMKNNEVYEHIEAAIPINEVVLQICRNLKCLRQFKAHYPVITKPDIVKQMKHVCPSLRRIEHNSLMVVFRITDFQNNVSIPFTFRIN